MHSHWIQILNRTNNDAVIAFVPDNFHLKLFPTDYRFFYENLVCRRRIQTSFDDLYKFLFVVGNSATGTTKSKRWPNNCWITNRCLNLERLLHAMSDHRSRAFKPDFGHCLFKFLSVLGLVNRFLSRPDHFDGEFLKHSMLRQIESSIKSRLTPHRWKQRIRSFRFNNFGDHFPGNRLDVSDIRELWISHYCRGI